MKLIIAGSRIFTDEKIVTTWLDSMVAGWAIDLELKEVVTGGANGVDSIAAKWACDRGHATKVFLADWNRFGKSAGPRRNIEMGDYSDYLIAIWDGKSTGTKHMINYMTSLGKPSFVFTFPV